MSILGAKAGDGFRGSVVGPVPQEVGVVVVIIMMLHVCFVTEEILQTRVVIVLKKIKNAYVLIFKSRESRQTFSKLLRSFVTVLPPRIPWCCFLTMGIVLVFVWREFCTKPSTAW